MSKLIYIVDDEDDIRRLVKIYLESEGYRVCDFTTGDELFEAFRQSEADLVILDIMLPGTDGLTICSKLREISTVPIIMLTAKDTDADFVAGITYGSDDYLVKPFRPTQLNMRVKALLRRVEMSKSEGMSEMEDISCGDLLYSKKLHAILVKDKELGLTTTELALLRYLMLHFEEAISRETLLNEVWGITSDVETRVTDEAVRKIRRKLRDGKSSVQIKNKWGYGYILKDGDEK